MPRKRTARSSLASEQENVTLICSSCGRELKAADFYMSSSDFYKATQRVPVCKECMENMYLKYKEQYEREKEINPDEKALRRMCMAFDLYFNQRLFLKSKQNIESGKGRTKKLFLEFMAQSAMFQYKTKTFDNTVAEAESIEEVLPENKEQETEKKYKITQKMRKFWGDLPPQSLIFLEDQFQDWCSRVEVESKAKEEIVKALCYTALQKHDALMSNQDTSKIDKTYLDQLDAAKLTPKQNQNDQDTDTQSFGTLIEKWETTKPIPETDPDLADVDNIGLYIDVFFKGHLARFMGLKNAISSVYTKFMEKFTVKKPETQDGEEDEEALFDRIFGSSDTMR